MKLTLLTQMCSLGLSSVYRISRMYGSRITVTGAVPAELVAHLTRNRTRYGLEPSQSVISRPYTADLRVSQCSRPFQYVLSYNTPIFDPDTPAMLSHLPKASGIKLVFEHTRATAPPPSDPHLSRRDSPSLEDPSVPFVTSQLGIDQKTVSFNKGFQGDIKACIREAIFRVLYFCSKSPDQY